VFALSTSFYGRNNIGEKALEAGNKRYGTSFIRKSAREKAMPDFILVLHECPEDTSQRISTYLFDRIKYASRQ